MDTRTHRSSRRIRYLSAGILTGLIFPLIALLLTQAFGLDDSTLIWLISLAPVVLGTMAYRIGRVQELLEEANQELEFAVSQRTGAIRSMLDISGQAVFSFDRHFMVLPEYSSYCSEFFNADIRQRDVRELLFEKESDREDFTQGVELLFNNRAEADVVFDLFDPEIHLAERLARVEYRFIAPDRVLVGITDITESKALNSKIAQEERNRQMVFTAVSHQGYFRDLLREAEELFYLLDSMTANGSREEAKIRKLQQLLHTFRGNLSFFHFGNTHQLVDELENYIADMLSLEQPLEFEGTGLALKRIYFQELRIIINSLGEDWLEGVDSIQLPRRQYFQLLQYIEHHYGEDKNLIHSLKNFSRIPFKNLFSQYPHLVKGLAQRLGKQLAPLVISGGDFSVIPEQFRELSAAIVHIMRNMVDHGIEPPWEREELGKPAEGSIAMMLMLQQHRIRIRISDDGRGIQYSHIAQIAREKGLIGQDEQPPREQLTKLLFTPGFSSSPDRGEISGKGIGLSALKAAVKSHSGTISVRTQLNKGTVFTIDIPHEDGSL